MISYELIDHEKAFIKITIENGKYAGQTLESHEISPCMDLTCGCANIYFAEDKAGKVKGTPYALEVDERMVFRISEKDITADENDFCLALSDAIPEESWIKLYQFYFSLKTSASELVSPDEIKVEFKNYHEIIQDSVMVSYKEKLPWAMTMFVEINEKNYYFDDFYCLMPNCECKEVQIVVFDEEHDNSLMSLLYNYGSNSLIIDEVYEKDIPSEAILEELKKKYESVISQRLPKRHQRIRKMFHNYLERKGIYPLRGAAKANAAVGRNAPCPCGSGKKYKVCCGE